MYKIRNKIKHTSSLSPLMKKTTIKYGKLHTIYRRRKNKEITIKISADILPDKLSDALLINPTALKY